MTLTQSMMNVCPGRWTLLVHVLTCPVDPNYGMPKSADRLVGNLNLVCTGLLLVEVALGRSG